MPLNTSPKAASTASATPSRVISRPEVSMGRQTVSSARAEALKTRLTQAPPAQPMASRPVGSSARGEQLSKLTKYSTQSPPPQAKPLPARTPARVAPSNLEDIAPPPSGLAEGESHVQPATDIEAAPPAEATSGTELSPQFAVLARKEQQVRKAQQELKAAQDAWKQDQAKNISKDHLLADPLKVLAELGITADKLVELQINQAAPPDPQQVLLDKISQLEAKLNGIVDPENGELAKRDQQAYDQTVKQIEADAQLLVDSNPAYGTIKSEGKTKDVVELITSVFDEEGTVLDVEEACQLIEDKLTEKLLADYQRLSKIEKIQNRLRKPAENPEEATPPAQQHANQAPKQTTLTNAGAATRQLSPRERAVLLVQERLNAAKGR